MTVTRVEPEELVQLCICDYASQLRGKGFPVRELPVRETIGMGLAPTNLMINAFGEIPATPWGSRGELIMLPDMSSQWLIPGDETHPDEHLVMADLMMMDGRPWPNCPRHLLRRALGRLREHLGLEIRAAFEHEFHYSGAAARIGDAYLAESVGSAGLFPGVLLATMRHNGIPPESFLAEFGPKQFEVTNASALGMVVADRAVQVREIVRRTARRFGETASFAPLMAPGSVGNGVHVHFSLTELAGSPASFDSRDPHGLSAVAGSFLAGILRDMPGLVALGAASVVSYDRLQPNRWSATYNNLGFLDREAGLRICAVPDPAGRRAGDTAAGAPSAEDPGRAYNFEYRAADVSGNPYLVLGALVWAGVRGIEDGLPKPPVTTTAPEDMTPEERQRLGLRHLPESLGEALDELASNERLREWLGDDFLSAYLTTKRGEIGMMAELSDAERVARYVAAY